MISIWLEEKSGISRSLEPIKIGLPFPKGLVHQCSQLQIQDQTGNALPLQATILARWSDSSIQWALVEFFAQVDANSIVEYHVEVLERSVTTDNYAGQNLAITDDAHTISVSTGAAAFEIPKNEFRPFQGVSVQEKGLLQDGGTKFHLIDSEGSPWEPIPKSFDWIAKGPLRATLRVNGEFSNHGKQAFALFTALLDFWVNCSFCSLRFQIHNPRAALHPGGIWDLGDPGSIYFKDLSLEIPFGQPVASIMVCPELGKHEESFSTGNLSLYQDSSGGEHWDSINHVDRNGDLTVNFQGYKLWSIEADEKKILEQGRRANPYFTVQTPAGWISGSIQDFWQNFPKALSVESGVFTISLFPRECTAPFELQGGEKKTHTIFLDFGISGQPNRIPQLLAPLQVHVDPAWISSSGVIPYLIPSSDDPNEHYLAYISNAVDGPNSFFQKREKIDEYGWRHYGDLYADHEAVHHKGKTPFISHYNNQFDFIHGAAIHFLRTGDYRWNNLMVNLAQHVMDIDIYHTDEDKPAYNHGLFWHTDHYRPAGRATHRTYSADSLERGQKKDFGGGPSNEHNYTSGLLLYYYLTGDIFAKEAVQELAQWVMEMDDGARTVWSLINEGPTGLASQTVFTDYHGPGRGAGNSINALMDAYKLTGDRTYLCKAEQLIRRCIHPDDDIEKLHLNEPEYKWSYLVFLQALGKYLDLKSELGELDWWFFYARDSLLHYANWMLEHEVPYSEVLHKVEIPTETWPAQDIRKSCVLNYAQKYGPEELRESFRDKARFFFNRSLKDLLDFDTAYLTRPMVLLSVYGYMQAYFDLNQSGQFQYLNHNYKFGKPATFKPQKMRLGSSLKQKRDVIIHALRYFVRSHYYVFRKRVFRKEGLKAPRG